jgi:hypothetical protein
MDVAARMLVLGGVAIVSAGALLWLGAKAGLGRLPGDIMVERDNFRLAVPIVTSIVLSIVLTIVLNVVLRLRRVSLRWRGRRR